MNGLLLTAGLGTRFLPFTKKIPKPAIPLLNVPIAYYNMHLLQQVNLDKLTVNVHHLPERVKKLFEDTAKIGIQVFFSEELDKILGTGGAIKGAQPSLEGHGTFVVANADVVNGFGIQDALEFHHQEQPMATMVVMKHPEAGRKYGAVWVDKKHRVVDISKEKPKTECEPFHFVGVHFLEEKIFEFIPKGVSDINKDVYLKAIKKGETVLAFEKSGLWFDAGTIDDFLAATKNLLGILPKLQHQPYFLSLYRRFWPDFDRRPSIWEGENCEHSLKLNNRILMDRNCRVAQNVSIKGFAVLGEGAIIEEGVTLENVVINKGVKVKSGKKLANTLVL